MLPFVGDLDETKIRVRAPTTVVFLCGGQWDFKSSVPLSLRDAFLKIADNPVLRKSTVIQAEDVTRLSLFGEHYRDFLLFETDLAQVTELIILFCESGGSLAELGAFSMMSDIASRLLVVVRDRYWDDDSFVKLGPLRSLENNYEGSVFVVNDADIGIVHDSLTHLKIEALKGILQNPIQYHLGKKRDHSTFDKKRRGHVIKLITGLIQEYGALELIEIEELLHNLDAATCRSTIASYLLCAKAVEWVTVKRRGFRTFYVANDLPAPAATLSVRQDSSVRDGVRRRLLIRDHWKQTDPDREASIRDVVGGQGS